MANITWSGRRKGKGFVEDAVQGVALIELSNGESKVFAFVGGLEAHDAFIGGKYITGKILGFAPLSGKVPVTIVPGTEAIFQPGDQYMNVPKAPADGFRLRYIDAQGAPWAIGAYYRPEDAQADGYDGQVLAWSAEYGSEENPKTLDAATLPDVEKKIRDNQVTKARRRPVLDLKNRLRDDEGPITIEDPHGLQGTFEIYALDNKGPKGETYFYAARSTPFSSEVVGPATSLDQLRGDVASYRDDASRAALGLAGVDDGLVVRADVDFDKALAETKASNESAAETRWKTILAWSAAGLLLWAGIQYDRKRGLY